MRITGQYRLSLGRLLQYKIIIKNPDRLYCPKWARLHARVSDTNDIITVIGMYVYSSYHLTKITEEIVIHKHVVVTASVTMQYGSTHKHVASAMHLVYQ